MAEPTLKVKLVFDDSDIQRLGGMSSGSATSDGVSAGASAGVTIAILGQIEKILRTEIAPGIHQLSLGSAGMGIFGGAGSIIFKALAPLLQGSFSGAETLLKDPGQFFENMQDNFGDLWDYFLVGIDEETRKTLSKSEQAMFSVLDAQMGVLDEAIIGAKKAYDTISEGIEGNTEGIVSSATNTFNKIIDTIGKKAEEALLKANINVSVNRSTSVSSSNSVGDIVQRNIDESLSNLYRLVPGTNPNISYGPNSSEEVMSRMG